MPAPAETRVRPASSVLEQRLARGAGWSADALAADQRQLASAIGSLVRRMNEPDLGGRDRDRVARAVGDMLALAEDLRRVRARSAARHDGERKGWRGRLAID